MARKVQLGICPICLKYFTLVESRALREHKYGRKTRDGNERERCPGSGQQPLDQSRLDLGVEV